MAAAAIRPGMKRHDLPTPALVVELDAFESNCAKMAAYVKGAGRAFRPHAKTHKSPDIAKYLIARGAAGGCAAKLSEAEALAAGGVTGLLVTSAVIGVDKIRRAVDLARRRPETIFSLDDAANAAQLNEAAAAARIRLNVAIDLWVGRRTGILPGEPALALATRLSSLKHLHLRGLQAYAGHASHTKGFEARRAASREAMAAAVETRRLLEAKGIPCAWLSGGSTGTYNIDSGIDGITELQPGSFMFMDMDYRRIGSSSGAAEYGDFATSLYVICTVISTPKPGMAVVDGGFKAFASDRGYGAEWRGKPQVKFSFGGDEHGVLELQNERAAVGDRLEFVVPHCDPTVNLYDQIYALRSDTVEAVWPLTARGRSQ